ncbi:Uncharacterised protein [Arthrobacter agilis]|uniref:hypothetical protein n=1 Tax=Arthrobacter agilis TaxID=37921 RepID=UPI000B568052|nr:hypothetical protein [Arthrobacter agilis]OUM42200.1 hypothetical protein B8W74_08785 [Arthrobacter agilis]VDR33614.1 Uncharacterised protein [Arthrobacter agilis]
MAKRQPGKPMQGRFRYGIKAPLVFSAALALVAGVATSIFATGGGTRELRVDLGLTAAGIAFIASLVICAMLMMAETPNAEHLSKGSGINRSSANPDRKPGDTPDTTAAKTPPATGPGSGSDDEPRFGERLPKQDG